MEYSEFETPLGCIVSVSDISPEVVEPRPEFTDGVVLRLRMADPHDHRQAEVLLTDQNTRDLIRALGGEY